MAEEDEEEQQREEDDDPFSSLDVRYAGQLADPYDRQSQYQTKPKPKHHKHN
jgi:hypothetical protein